MFTGGALSEFFELQAGVGLELIAVVIGLILRALWREWRSPERTRPSHRSYR